jgi:iron complex transport system ATP-binding protein
MLFGLRLGLRRPDAAFGLRRPDAAFASQPPDAALEARDLTLGYHHGIVLHNLHLSVRSGRVLALAGPNGAGKTTLLRSLARLLRPRQGIVLLDGRDVWRFSERDTARRLGLVPQNEAAEWPLTVEQVVMLGRAAHRGWFMPYTAADHRAVDDALAQTGLTPLRARLLTELSGGERQRVLIARALAQEPAAILLDEPTAQLDLRYQAAVLGLTRRLAHERGLAVVVSLHDLNLVALYADQVALIADGGLVAEGSPADVLTPDHLQRAYGVPVAVGRHPVYGTPLVMPVMEG